MRTISHYRSVIYWLLPAAIILLSAFLRFHDLGSESYWYDELIMVRVAQEEPAEILRGGRPPVYVLLAHYWIDLFGTSETATRSLSAVAGVASIPLLFLIGQLLFGREVGLVSGLLMAISQFHVFYSQDFRYYSLFAFLTLLSYYFFIMALRKRRVVDFVLYSLVTILLFHTHTFGLFIIVAQNLYFFSRWRMFKQSRLAWLVSQAAILLSVAKGLAIAWMMAVEGHGGPSTWLPEPSIRSPLSTLLRFLGLVGVTSEARAGLGTLLWTPVLVGSVFLVVVTAAFAFKKGPERWWASIRDRSAIVRDNHGKGDELLLVGLWLVVPMLIPLVLSRILGPIYHDRYMIGALPALCLLVAYAVRRVSKVVPALATVGLLAILITPGLYAFYKEPLREQWREAAAYVVEGSRSGDVIIFAESGRSQNQKNFDWYYRGGLRECGIDRYATRDEVEEAGGDCLEGSRRFWLVVRHAPRPSPDFKTFFLPQENNRFRLIEKRGFSKLTVYLFETN